MHDGLKKTTTKDANETREDVGQEATVRTGHGTTDWFQIGKGCILSPCLFNCMQNTSCQMQGWMKHKLKSKLPGEISKPQKRR